MIATRREAAGRHRVTIDGNRTRLLVVKGQPPKYGTLQEWDVIRADAQDRSLVVAYGLHDALSKLETIYAEMAGMAKEHWE
jgi:hypothetical protein